MVLEEIRESFPTGAESIQVPFLPEHAHRNVGCFNSEVWRKEWSLKIRTLFLLFCYNFLERRLQIVHNIKCLDLPINNFFTSHPSLSKCYYPCPFFFNYSPVVDVQGSANFCYTAKWLSHTYIYILFYFFIRFSIRVYLSKLDIVHPSRFTCMFTSFIFTINTAVIRV